MPQPPIGTTGGAVPRHFPLAPPVLAWLAGLFLLLTGAAAAQDHIVEQHVLEDPTNDLTIDDVAGLPFQALGGILSEGYTDSAFWIRLTVSPSVDGLPLVLRIWPTYLDAITLFEPDGEGGWRTRHTGDRIPYAGRMAAVSLGFEIRPDEPTVYYLRLKTTSSSMMGISAIPAPQFHTDDLTFGFIGTLFLWLMGGMLVWAGTEYLHSRDPLLLWYVAVQVTSIFYGALITGYMALLLPGVPLDGVTSVFVCLAGFTQLLFYLQLMRNFDVPRAAYFTAACFALVGIVVLGLLATGLTRIAMQLNATTVLIAPPLITTLAFLARRDAPPGLAVVRLAGVVQTVALLVTTFPLLGLTPATELSRQGVLFHGAVSGAIAFLILRARSVQLRRAAGQLEATSRQLEVERREHDVRGRFLAILAHELKTPLSVVRLALDTLPAESRTTQRIGGAVDSMTALIDLSAYAERLEHGELAVDRETILLPDLLGRIAAEPQAQDRVRLQAPAGLAISTDMRLLGVVVRNLVDNALKYSPSGSVVDIVVTRLQAGGHDGVTITIENVSGRDSAPDPERIFDKFYRGPGASAKSGLGLGLYVVRGIAEVLGASVTCEVSHATIRFQVYHPC